MKISKIAIIFSIVLAILLPVSNAATPDITATSAIVIDCTDGKILYEKNINEKLYPTSLTKILTAILVVENCSLEDNVTVSQSAISNVQSGYLTANIKPGEVFTVEQLLNLLFISSYSDVANVLAEHVSGSIEEFSQLMNQKAKQIGCKNSNFVNCNGEHDTEHYSTAYDLGIIAKYAMQYETLRNIASKKECELPATDIYTNSDRKYYTTNEMLKSSTNNYYKGAKGIKTGFTTPAGYCLAVYTDKNDMPLVSIVLKSTTGNSRYEDSKAILDYAYDNNLLRTIATQGTNIQTINVKGGSSKTKKLNAILDKNVVAVVKNENKTTNVEPKIEINEKLKAPVTKGETIGKVSYSIEGKTYTANLIAETEVKKSKTGLTFLLIFIGLLVVFGGLRVLGIYKRTKTLRKVRK